MVIDISEWQVGMDYSKLKSSNVEAVIVRAGRSTSSGNFGLVEDKMFRKHIEGVLKEGVPVGAYWFSYAVNSEQARREAKRVD